MENRIDFLLREIEHYKNKLEAKKKIVEDIKSLLISAEFKTSIWKLMEM